MNTNAKKAVMTSGSISRCMVSFAIPVFLGNLFQQLYNVVDSLVVGNFLGKDELAAVSSSGSLIFLLVGFLNGIFVGAGVVISRYFGARQKKDIHDAVHTTIAFGIAAGLVLSIVGVIITPVLLRLMGTPDAVIDNSILYFRVYFCGVFAMTMYNVGNGIYQAVGDGRHPLYYLICSSVTNVILDLLFVAVLGFGIGSAAFATVIAQFVAASLAFRRLTKINDDYRVNFKEIKFYPGKLSEILKMGLPTGVQNSIIAFANVIVQSNINAFGESAVAGCGIYAKIEGFAFLPITSFSMALTTFIGQNLGAKQHERAKKGAYFGIAAGVIIAELIGVITWFLIPYFARAFNKDAAVISYSVLQARTMSLFYCLLAFTHCIAGILRGAGKTQIPMYVMLLCWCILRITYITIAVKLFPVIRTIFWAYPITWSLSSIVFLIYFLKADWLHAYDKSPMKKYKSE